MPRYWRNVDGLKVRLRRRCAGLAALVLLMTLGLPDLPSGARLAMGGALPPGPCGPASPTPPRIRLDRVADGFSSPVYLTHAGDRSGRLFVVEQGGTVRVLRGGRLLPRPYLDIRHRLLAGGERGLLSVAFHPRYRETGRLFVNYTARPDGRTVIAEYRVLRTDPDVADSSERVLLEIPQPFANHNGGLIKFGPDGFLYIGMGDGGSGGDPQNHAQTLGSALGKLLRLDVNGRLPYAVPPHNPFVGRQDARPEVWAYGLRNPWRFAFDRCTGRLFLGDVGQSGWEEINLIEKGGNYGWRIMEGNHCFNPSAGCRTDGLIPPIAEYPTSLGCAVTGGYVYRGTRWRGLAGWYLYGDYCGGQIWGLRESAPGRWTSTLLLKTDLRISSFGEGEDGELYIVHHGGAVYHITAP